MSSLRIEPKIQSAMIDVAGWGKDPDHAVFPQGARDKSVVLAPSAVAPSFLCPGKRYMFKLSSIHPPYPEQFWGEVIAYRVGCLMGLAVPHTFAAINSATGQCGALSEWFYDAGRQIYTQAGDCLEEAYPAFDRKKGLMHNLVDIESYLGTLTPPYAWRLTNNWRQWWFDALVFDALIGNTDRHQDNWGFILTIDNHEISELKLTPLFDNGTSLGHERETRRVNGWSDEQIQEYILKGKHHVKWSLQDTPAINGHFELIRKAATHWPQVVAASRNRLNFSSSALTAAFADLSSLHCHLPLTSERVLFTNRLLQARLNRLTQLLDECLSAKPSF